MRILYLDHSPSDRALVREILTRELPDVDITEVASRETFETLLAPRAFDVALVASDAAGVDDLEVLDLVQRLAPRLPTILAVPAGSEALAAEAMQRGAAGCVMKTPGQLSHLPLMLQRAGPSRPASPRPSSTAPEAAVSPDFLQSVIDALTGHLAILDHTGTIIMVNAAWRQFASDNGYPDTPFGVGKNYLEICDTASGAHSEWAHEVAAGIRDVLSGRRDAFALEYPCHSSDVQRWFLVRVGRFVNDGRAYALTVHETITERKQADIALRQRVQQLQAVRAVSFELTHELDLDRVLGVLVQQVRSLIPTTEAVVIFMWDEASQRLRPHLAHGTPPWFYEVRLPLGKGITGTVAARRIGMLVDDYPNSGYVTCQRSQALALKALMAEPLMYQGRLLGVLTVGHRTEPRPFAPEDQELLTLFAAQASVAIANAQLFTAVQQRATQLAQTNAVLQDEIAKSKRLEADLLTISEREQRRFGQELHDSLGQKLTGIALLGKVLEQDLEAKSLAEVTAAAELVRLVNQTIVQTRDLSRALYPVDLETGGLPTALETLARQTQTLFHLSCQVGDLPFASCLPLDVALHLYRIAQEAVHNAVQHSQARQVVIHADAMAGGFRLMIDDDGIGFDSPAEGQTGLGLRLMQYRAETIGGTLTIQRLVPQGTRVACTLPQLPDPDVPGE